MATDMITTGVKCVQEISENATLTSWYNEKGLITDFTQVVWGTPAKAKYYYDGEDKLVRTEWYGIDLHKDYEGDYPEYELTAFIVFEYDKQGNLIDEKRYKVNNERQEHTLNEYDDLNRLITQRHFQRQESDIVYFDTYKYDNLGNKIESERQWGRTDRFSRSVSKYDENGRMILSQSGSELDEIRLSEYKYDQYGNVIEITTRNYQGNLLDQIINIYDYDQVGNWIKWKSIEKGIPSGSTSITERNIDITERVIEYYNVL